MTRINKLIAKESKRQMIINEIRRVTDADFSEDGPAAWHTLINGLEKKCPMFADLNRRTYVNPGRKEWLQLIETIILSIPEKDINPVVRKN